MCGSVNLTEGGCTVSLSFWFWWRSPSFMFLLFYNFTRDRISMEDENPICHSTFNFNTSLTISLDPPPTFPVVWPLYFVFNSGTIFWRLFPSMTVQGDVRFGELLWGTLRCREQKWSSLPLLLLLPIDIPLFPSSQRPPSFLSLVTRVRRMDGVSGIFLVEYSRHHSQVPVFCPKRRTEGKGDKED